MRHTSRSKKPTIKQIKKSKEPNRIITILSRKIKMIYVGIDIHKVFLQVAAMDEQGELILNERVPTDHFSIKKFFAQFPVDAIHYVMESSSVWYGLCVRRKIFAFQSSGKSMTVGKLSEKKIVYITRERKTLVQQSLQNEWV